MTNPKFEYGNDVGPTDEKHLKCHGCGHVALWREGESYDRQSKCTTLGCHGSMMSWDWGGWKAAPERAERYAEQERVRSEAESKPVSQETEPLDSFTEDERTIPVRGNPLVVNEAGTEAPWMSAFGACLVKVYGMRRLEGQVQFGIGDEELPILGWVGAGDFYEEWPQ